MFKNRSIGFKILSGYTLVGLVLAGAVFATLWQVNRTQTVVNRLVDLRAPTAEASLRLLNGVNASLAALRGWIILGDEEFKSQRENAWSKGIDPAVKALQNLSRDWIDSGGRERLRKITTNIENMKNEQVRIEAIAQTPENTPATHLLTQKAAPIAEKLGERITRIIDIEGTLEATAMRKQLLNIMADVRGSLGLAVANIRAYLITGDTTFQNRYGILWEKEKRRFEELQQAAALLTPEQQLLLDDFAQNIKTFGPIAKEILQIRGSNEWNKAQAWMADNLVPVVNALETDLADLLQAQDQAMTSEQTRLKNEMVLLIRVEWMLLAVGLSLCVAAGLLISRAITRPLSRAAVIADQLSEGDLTVTVEQKSKDETGRLFGAMGRMVEGLRAMMGEIRSTTDSLSSASEQLSSLASEMAASSEQMNSNADTVAAASEQASGSVGNVASSAEESSSSVSSVAAMTEEMSTTFENMVEMTQKTSGNVNSIAQAAEDIASGVRGVASASEEMTASLNEVARQTSKASNISKNADQLAESVNVKMTALVDASKQIGKVVGVIKDIADQTNMLALNATIEAAGAGDAGKGFAVVAGEVKELARQSADATEEIAGQIDQIQKSTNDAVSAIKEISDIIGEIAAINESIAASAEEQTATANEISRSIAGNAETVNNMAGNAADAAGLVSDIAGSTDETAKTAREIAVHLTELSNGVTEVARSAEEAAAAARDISKNIQGVGVAAKETASGASQMDNAAGELARMAATLSEIVNRFRL